MITCRATAVMITVALLVMITAVIITAAELLLTSLLQHCVWHNLCYRTTATLRMTICYVTTATLCMTWSLLPDHRRHLSLRSLPGSGRSIWKFPAINSHLCLVKTLIYLFYKYNPFVVLRRMLSLWWIIIHLIMKQYIEFYCTPQGVSSFNG